MALLTAILTASILAVIGFPYSYYQCWFSWSRWGTAAGLALYFLLTGAGGGVIGCIVAALGKAAPTDNSIINGFFYGIVGAIALRTDAGAKPKNAEVDHLREAKSLLNASINWVADLLDQVSYSKADRWLRELDDDSLIIEVNRIVVHISRVPTKKMTDKAKADLHSRLVPKMQVLADKSRKDEHAEARERLIDFCAHLYKDEHIAKNTSATRKEIDERQGVPE